MDTKVVYTCNSAIQRNEIFIHATTCMDLENILSEITDTEGQIVWL